MRLKNVVFYLVALDQAVNFASFDSSVLEGSHFDLVLDLSHASYALLDGFDTKDVAVGLSQCIPVSICFEYSSFMRLSNDMIWTHLCAPHIHLVLQIQTRKHMSGEAHHSCLLILGCYLDGYFVLGPVFISEKSSTLHALVGLFCHGNSGCMVYDQEFEITQRVSIELASDLDLPSEHIWLQRSTCLGSVNHKLHV